MTNQMSLSQYHLLRASIAQAEFMRLAEDPSVTYQQGAYDAVTAADCLLDALGIVKPTPLLRDEHGRFVKGA